MIREHVVITPIRITKSGQVKHFQVKLPKNTKRIIGIELGGRWLTDTKTDGGVVLQPKAAVSEVYVKEQFVRETESRTQFFKRNTLIGELKLQSCEEANIFYAGDLQLDNNIGLGDFSQSAYWRPAPFSHQSQTFEEVVIVDGESTMIQGVYKDRFGAILKTPANYLVNVYVWTEIEEPENRK